MTYNNPTGKEIWYFLISGQQDSDTGIVGNFYAYGEHLGEALDRVFKVIIDYNFNNPDLIEASLVESFDVIGDNHELIEIADRTFMRSSTYTFPFDDPEKDFVPPTGVVKIIGDDDYEYELIKENFVAYGQDENGIFEFELVVSKDNLIDVFFKTIDFLPTIDGFWIYIKNYWDNNQTELWTAKHFTDKTTVIDFLKSQRINTLENGYLDIVVHSITGETNLTLDDHKKIQLHTKDETLFNSFIGQIIDLGYEQTREFYNLEFGYFHWHYRPVDSLSRDKFKSLLVDNKFELIDKWDE